jgi:hypothetical protein
MFQAATHAATLTPAITTLNRVNTTTKAVAATGMETAGAAKLKLFVDFLI